MSAGTLTLTNSADAVTGSGTSFTTELAAGDFIVVTVGGVPYTLPVKAINNNTSLTLVSAYTGPTQSGAAWYAVPRVALNMVTAALVAQSTEALRGLNYDKQNWQQVFSAPGTINVKLPDGSTFSGPSWKYLATRKINLNSEDTSGVLPLEKGGSGYSTREGLRQASIMNGVEGTYGSINNLLTNFNNYAENGGGFSFRDADTTATSTYAFGASILSRTSDTYSICSVSHSNGNLRVSGGVVNGGIATTNYINDIWGSINTTVDSNGFIKKASPVVIIYHDGSYETNHESEGCVVERISVGEYLITGCVGLNSDAAWGGIDGGFEIPVDRNKQSRIWLDYKVNADGSVLVKTYHRTYPQSPEFARNEIDNLKSGEPIDIPSDSFVSVRVEMPENSIWNQKQEAGRIVMEETMMKEERTDGNNV
ncbi:phage tail protein [Salmonella enterica]|nr:phage tail protein [Salmonella enterica]